MNKLDPTKLKKPSAADLLIIERLNEVIDAVEGVKKAQSLIIARIKDIQEEVFPGTQPLDTCLECGGSGEVWGPDLNNPGNDIKVACASCHGTGKKPEDTQKRETVNRCCLLCREAIYGRKNEKDICISLNAGYVARQERRHEEYDPYIYELLKMHNCPHFQLKKELVE